MEDNFLIQNLLYNLLSQNKMRILFILQFIDNAKKNKNYFSFSS